jgi:DNA-binding ferritin-like protein
MLNLAIALRSLQLYAHNCHNLASGMTFFSDHSFFGDVYAQAEVDYDSIIERLLGMGKDLDLYQVQYKACESISNMPVKSDNEEYFKQILKMKLAIIKQVDALAKAKILPSGTEQLVTEISNKTEVDVYKIRQRLK